jgi:hypothetical protein
MASDRVRLSFLFVGNYTSSTNMFSETLQVPLKASKSPKRMGILPHFSGYLEGLVTKSSWLLVVLSGRMRKPGECRWGDFSHQWLSSLAVKSLETITSMVLDWKSMIKVGHSHSIFKVIAKHYFFSQFFWGAVPHWHPMSIPGWPPQLSQEEGLKRIGRTSVPLHCPLLPTQTPQRVTV